MGCGRSGTTMMINIFHRDHRVEALGENDPKIANDFMLDFQKMPDALRDSKAPLLVMKPILNSFDAADLLDTYPDSKTLWIVRDYKDMVASSLNQFGTEVPGYMKDFVLKGKGKNWLTRGMTEESRKIISDLETSKFTHCDWMALIWWCVNQTVILDRLFRYDGFFMIHYEALVSDPEKIMQSVYKFVGLKYQKKAVKYIHTTAIGKGANIILHAEVESLCLELAETLKQSAGMK
jgi:hypothetical protein